MHNRQRPFCQTAVLHARSPAFWRRRFTVAAAQIALFMLPGVAAAACPPLPYTLQNGQTADATQVMANFNGVLSCPLFTGNVGVGITAPPYLLTNSQFVVYDDANIHLSNSGLSWLLTDNSKYVAIFSNLGTLGNGVDIYVQGTNAAQRLLTLTNGSSDLDVFLANGSVGLGTSSPTTALYVNGVTTSTGGFSQTSDARLKKRVTSMTDGLALVEALRPVRFQWMEGSERQVGGALVLPTDRPQIGFLAQEVEKVVPEAITAPTDKNDVYSMDETKLVPILVEAVKEQEAEIGALQSQIADLKSAVAAQRSAH